jgi:hypothetical protein
MRGTVEPAMQREAGQEPVLAEPPPTHLRGRQPGPVRRWAKSTTSTRRGDRPSCSCTRPFPRRSVSGPDPPAAWDLRRSWSGSSAHAGRHAPMSCATCWPATASPTGSMTPTATMTGGCSPRPDLGEHAWRRRLGQLPTNVSRKKHPMPHPPVLAALVYRDGHSLGRSQQARSHSAKPQGARAVRQVPAHPWSAMLNTSN